ncbi:MAG: leucine-rich repeat domain-containing protein [Oscillospiraceae bacterium]
MTELDELKQRLEIEELRGRLSAAEKQISILTDTLATLTEIQTSDRLGSYINSQVRLLKAAEFLNSVSDGEKIAPQLQRQSVEQAGLRKAELDAHISRTVQLSKEKSLHTVDSRIANAVDNWQSSTSAQDPKLFTYRNEGGGITITGLVLRRDFGGEAIQPSVLEIPSAINGIPVTKIGDGAFRGCHVQKVKFPEGLRTIGKDAFSGCGQLSAAAFPDSLMSVGAGAFASCGFHSLHLENTSLAVIPEKCFGWCSGLQKLALPEGLLSIENNAFAECRALTRLIVPENTLTVESPFSSFTGGAALHSGDRHEHKLVDICGLTISGRFSAASRWCRISPCTVCRTARRSATALITAFRQTPVRVSHRVKEAAHVEYPEMAPRA